MKDFRQALRKRAILFDGAMGTELYRRGVFINRCYDDLCRTEPETVREIHQAYREAGADVLETNSFGANRFQLQAYGLEDEVEAVNRAAGELARDVAGSDLFVAGSMGPLGVRLEPYGPTSRREAREAFREQAVALVAAGVDLLCLETFSDLAELVEAVMGCREAAPDMPVVAQVTIQPDGSTSYGVSPGDVARELSELGVDAVGLNCSVGPALLVEGVREMSAATDLPVAAIPNAGLPREVGGRKMYLASPDYMASYTRVLVEAGARIVGGCCGTRPRHIEQMARQLRAVTTEDAAAGRPSGETADGRTEGAASPRGTARTVALAAEEAGEEREAPDEPVPLEERSELGRRLDSGERVTAVEIVPPRGADVGELVRAGQSLRREGVDAVVLPDDARGSMRMGVMAAAALLQRETEIEAVAGYSCRDRNLVGMGSDLLGAQALGVRNLLLVTGDPPKMGPYPDVTAVFDIDSIGLTNLVTRLNRGRDLGDNPVGGRTSFVVGVRVNASAVDMERELRRWYWKVDAGAEFAITRPVFDPGRLMELLERMEEQGTRIPVLVSVRPMVSLREAEFLAHEVPGIEVPESILRRMREAQRSGPEAARKEGREVAREILEDVGAAGEGVCLAAPTEGIEEVLGLLQADAGRRTGPAGPG